MGKSGERKLCASMEMPGSNIVEDIKNRCQRVCSALVSHQLLVASISFNFLLAPLAFFQSITGRKRSCSKRCQDDTYHSPSQTTNDGKVYWWEGGKAWKKEKERKKKLNSITLRQGKGFSDLKKDDFMICHMVVIKGVSLGKVTVTRQERGGMIHGVFVEETAAY
ncbi:hypothetical protein CEXT_438091 [Caerostris extrusa]|uniref:Uncharacterized protein n=1 Tax=Caerostris extrusa TaxID=172846 RepID=A0AAV4MBK4_CAEEX|nr:hypothetical protein CEXT_438091 [Caerostris extrusa]